MRDKMIKIDKIDSARELESVIPRDNIITFDEIQNTYYKISIDEKFIVGVEYCSHGIKINYMLVHDESLLFIGIGMHLLCIDMKNKKILFTKELQSVFYEIIADTNHNYLCIVCELDIYCYVMEKEVWKMGFRDILIDFNIIDNKIIFALCDNGEEFKISIEDGKIL